MHLIPTILCGGAGSRLWPLSRELHPKPFIRLADGQSFLQKTFLRAAALSQVKEVLTVTNRELFFKIKDEFQQVNQHGLNTSFILEPFVRNTAAAVAAAALQVISTYGEEACLLILPADHLIADLDAFTLAIEEAKKLAQQGLVVTFGIQPTRPETGYGYIEAKDNKVINFIEKPSLIKAQEYFNSKLYLWNSGIFCFTAKTLLQEMKIHCPEILLATTQCLEQSKKVSGEKIIQIELDAITFNKVPENSIDYALIEKSKNLAIVPCNMGWNDIGSWNALGNLVPSDLDGNRVEGQALLYETANCYIRSESRMIGAVGIKNLLVIETPDAILVADKSYDQEVKHIYARLKEQKHEAHKFHRQVHRPWGNYTVLEEGPRFKIKRIEVKPGASLSLQMHHHRSEHWVVVSGMAKVINGDEEMFIRTNESTYIPAGHKHRLENPGVLPLIMIEVQSGDYMGEDDILRFEDAYGRV